MFKALQRFVLHVLSRRALAVPPCSATVADLAARACVGGGATRLSILDVLVSHSTHHQPRVQYGLHRMSSGHFTG